MLPLLALAPLTWAHSGPITATATAQPAGLEDLEDEYEQLLDEYTQAYDAWYKSLTQAEESEQAEIFGQMPGETFVPRFVELAGRAGTSDVAFDAWLWVFSAQKASKPQKLDALEKLVLDHMASPRLEKLVEALDYAWYAIDRQPVEDALTDIRSQSEHDSVLAAATFMLGNLYMAHEETEKGLPLLREVRQSYGETSWAAKAERFLFEAERLQIGMLAPDFQAVDQDGIAFKLSDYKGKVVLLDFWGFW